MIKLPRKMADRLNLRFGSAMGALRAIPKSRLGDYCIVAAEEGQWRIAERDSPDRPRVTPRDYKTCPVCQTKNPPNQRGCTECGRVMGA